MKELFPENTHLQNWLDLARERIAFQGLPARICWIGLGDRHRAGLAFNEMVKNGELKAPVVIGRDHLDSGSVASPNRETEAMMDGSDAVSDWPLLNAMLNTASGATWVSLHHGGGVGMGFSQHAGMVICADGTDEAAARLERVLWNDPATGVMRHADAGYGIAKDWAMQQGLRLPGVLDDQAGGCARCAPQVFCGAPRGCFGNCFHDFARISQNPLCACRFWARKKKTNFVELPSCRFPVSPVLMSPMPRPAVRNVPSRKPSARAISSMSRARSRPAMARSWWAISPFRPRW